MPKVGASAPSAIACPLQERPMHLLPPMSKLGQMQGVMHFAFLGLFDAHQRHPSGLAARGELDSHRLHLTRCQLSILEPDGEGDEPMHHCSFAGKQ